MRGAENHISHRLNPMPTGGMSWAIPLTVERVFIHSTKYLPFLSKIITITLVTLKLH
ncbi:MAG: hypothetical protein AAF298_03180 [Cyanobacteria bacterium P01_A01_bin.40]